MAGNDYGEIGEELDEKFDVHVEVYRNYEGEAKSVIATSRSWDELDEVTEYMFEEHRVALGSITRDNDHVRFHFSDSHPDESAAMTLTRLGIW